MNTELETTTTTHTPEYLRAFKARSEAIMEAHIATHLKIKLLKLHRGDVDEERSYLDLGYHVGRCDLDGFCEDLSLVEEADEAEVLAHPNRVLRRIFASEEHPRGDFVDLIPHGQRRDFLLGILAGAAENGPGEGWLAL